MLHLIYYFTCLHDVDDVREQNRAAFELYKLGNPDFEVLEAAEDGAY